MAERIKNNLLKYELSKKDNKWVKYRLLFPKNSRSNYGEWLIIIQKLPEL